jgi:diguanylate cyclase (GGDEF)-like protein
VTILRRIDLARPVVPLAGILAIAFAAVALRTDGTAWLLVAVAAGLAGLGILAARRVPWRSLPESSLIALPVACDAVIALLRESQGGSTSGYSPLALLPVVWVGLALRRRDVAMIVGCTAALFAVPIVVVGAPTYPASGWRGVVLWTVVAALVGLGANRVMAMERRQTRLAASRADDLARLVATQAAIATGPFELETVMTTVVERAQELTGATAAVIELPDGDDLVYRAAAGTAVAHLGLRLPLATAISGRALRTRQALVSGDTENDSRVDRDACRRVGARSLVVVPLLYDGEGAGVLKVSAGEPHAFHEEHVQVLSLLADMVGSALARAELLDRLREQAVTDELTGLPNRRAWNRQLELALGRARRSSLPLSVVVLDVDGLKAINDTRGHAAGDRLLRTITGRWAAAIRETDVLGRLGGDEFGLLLEGADEHEAEDVVERLGAALGADEAASAGSATWDGVEDSTGLLARADRRMYEQKQGRRGGRKPAVSAP